MTDDFSPEITNTQFKCQRHTDKPAIFHTHSPAMIKN